MQNIAIAGLGPHARYCYYPTFERRDNAEQTNIKLVIDLEDQRALISSYLAQQTLIPENIIYLAVSRSADNSLGPDVRDLLDTIHQRDHIHKLLVATEPKAHKGYVLWALKNNVDVMIEKPLTAATLDTMNPDSPTILMRDYLDIESNAMRSRSQAVLMAPRRRHSGYMLIRDYLSKFIAEFDLPITYLGIYHADGACNLPEEFHSRENHPYKYGYGKLMHSGYHHIDLFMWLIQLNQALAGRSIERVEISTRHVSAGDSIQQIGIHNYRNLFPGKEHDAYFAAEELGAAQQFGETDICILLQMKCGNIVLSTGSINLLQTSLSQRAWPELRDPMYNKSTGRVTRERLTVQVGHLLNIEASLHPVPIKEATKIGTPRQENRFDITICRNAALVGGQAFEEISLPGGVPRDGDRTETGLLRQAREEIMALWMSGLGTGSELQSHRSTIKMLAKIYESMFRQNCGLSPVVDFSFLN
jgi:hypothetical protein